MKNRRAITLLVILAMIFSLLTGTTFGSDHLENKVLTNSSINLTTTSGIRTEKQDSQENSIAYVRIEGDKQTLIPKTQVTLEDIDLSKYNAQKDSKNKEDIVVLQAIIEALELSGYDATSKEVLELENGSYISSICGLEAVGKSGWMYELNGKSSNYSVNAQPVEDNDEIVVYFIEDWQVSNYAYFTEESKEIEGGNVLELNLMYDALNMTTWETETKPCANASVLIDGEVVGTTDPEGKITLTLNKKGVYYISASKYNEQGTNLISRPYCKVNVTSDAKEDFNYKTAIQTAQQWIQSNVDFSEVKYKVNGTPDWNAFALVRSGESIPDSYYEGMKGMIKGYKSIDAFKVKMKKVTEYERMAIGITASGNDATNVEGVNFIENIYNNEAFTKQGANGIIYGLLAVDSHNYEVPDNACYTRQKMIELLLEEQTDDGGWELKKNTTDIDLTAMAIQALTPYYEKEQAVQQAVDMALNYLANQQEQDGGYISWGNANPESVAQVLVALSGLGIDCKEDARFIKNDNTLLDALGIFYNKEDGGFKHSLDDDTNEMATQQVLYGLAAYERFLTGKNNLYDMTDITFESEKSNEIDLENNETVDLSNPKEDVKINVADDFEVVQLDTTKVAQDMPQVTIDFNEHEIVLPEGTTIKEATDKVLKLTMLKSDELESYKKQLVGIKNIEDAFDFGNEGNVKFNGFITLIFKNQGKHEAGYIDHNGIAHTITKAPNNIEGLNEYCIKQGNDLVIKTKHLTTFLTYSKTETDKGENNTGSKDKNEDKIAKINVTISVDAKTINQGYIIPTKSINLKEDATAFDALKSLGLSLDTTGSGKDVYVAYINGLGEFDHGKLSGWMYSVNGTFPQVGLGSYTLSEGDVIEVRYTTNGGKDLGDKAAALISGTVTSGGGAGGTTSDTKYTEVIDETVKQLKAKQSLDEWELIGLANKKELNEKVKKQLLDNVIAQKGEYRKVTDLERMIIALSAADLDAQNIQGLNLIQKLYNRESVSNQGSNGIIFALVALDSRNYQIPNQSKWTREKLIKSLLTYQNKDGGFSLAEGEESNIDITAMALTSLAPYKDTQKESIEKAIMYLSKNQKTNGEFAYGDVESSESTAQVIIALSSLNIDVTKDTRFIKNNRNLIDVLTKYYVSKEGFKHVLSGNANQMATEQALLALLSYEKLLQNASGIYSFENVKTDNTKDIVDTTNKLSEFEDQQEISNWAKEDIEEAIKLGIIQGSNNKLNPKDKVTRAEFVTMLLKVLEKETNEEVSNKFADVPKDAWYSKAIDTAWQLELVEGISDKHFMPGANVTREQMAVILNRLLSQGNTNKIPTDISTVAPWAQNAVLVMYNNELMQGANNRFKPKQEVTREMAVVILMRFRQIK